MKINKYLLHVGIANKYGTLTSQNWLFILNWIIEHIDNIVIESSFGIKNYINELLIESITFEELESPCPEMDIEAIRIQGEKYALKTLLNKIDYYFDNIIEYVFFYSGTTLKGSINIDDDNYIVLYLTQDESNELSSNIPNIDDNISYIKSHNDEIDFFKIGTDVTPLGL